MDCTKAQRLLHELPPSQLGDAVSRHLSECTDCRVAQQRAVRLQQLLTVKRHETPGSHYFENFLDTFHRRLADESTPQPSWWERWLAPLHMPHAPILHRGFAHACGLVLLCGLVLRGLIGADLTDWTSASQASMAVAPSLHTVSVSSTPQSTPRKIAAMLPAVPRRAEPTAMASGALIIPVVTRGELNASRYVLDRISLSPASYEVASIQF